MSGNGLINVDIGSVVKSVGSVADDLFTSDEERLKLALDEKQIDADLQKGQMDVNLQEAKSGKSWRHWVGRVGAISLALYFIPQYVIAAILWCKACWVIEPINGIITLPPYPANADQLLELIIGMLGLGTIKAVENITGVKQETTKKKKKSFWPWSK